MTVSPSYIDPKTQKTFPLDKPLWRSPDGNPLMITDLPGITKDDIDFSERSIWRYKKALPLEITQPITLGEGLTPLLPRELAGTEVHYKVEWFAPTGSFKDRGASVMLSYLRQAGVLKILEDSSGNGGSAIAAYGAAGSVGVRILTPETTQSAKLAQMRAFGAEVQLVPGPRENSEIEAIRQSGEIFYASHNWQAFFLQGTKLLAYELWEDCGFKAPDNVVVPASAGSNILGLHIGFSELLRAGQIDRLPRLFCAQPENCAPVDAALRANATDQVAFKFEPTIAEGTAIKEPVRMVQILEALRNSNGGTVTANETEIEQSVRDLASMGLYAEPTAAFGAIATQKLLKTGVISPQDKTVIVLTGSGLKASAYMTGLFCGV